MRDVPSAMQPDQAREVVELAVRAPSLHNTQPWCFVLREGALELRADRSRQLPGTDPEGRQLTISCGAALFGARLGVRVLGYLPSVDLVPEDWQPDLLARVHLGGTAPMDAQEVALANAVATRRSLRSGFIAGDVEASVLTAVQQAAATERTVLLTLTDPTRRLAATELLAAADRAQKASTEVIRELAQWTSRTADDADGLPPGTWPEEPPPRHAGGFPVRDFSRRKVAEPAGRTTRPSTALTAPAGPPGLPVAAALLTRGDTPADWLRAGQALHRLLLTATCAGVQASLHSQPFGLLGLRRLLQQEFTGGAEPQMLLQLGHMADEQPSRPFTPRRAVNEVLVVT